MALGPCTLGARERLNEPGAVNAPGAVSVAALLSAKQGALHACLSAFLVQRDKNISCLLGQMCTVMFTLKLKTATVSSKRLAGGRC